jgi:putative membrane protein
MNWDNDWNHGGGPWWLFMVVMMILFWGSIAWIVVTLIRHNTHHHPDQTPAPDAERILHERVARGEIDVEEYERRLQALRSNRTG